MAEALLGVLGDGAVARLSGVAKTTLYRRFGGLDRLVFAAVAARVSEVEDPDTGSLMEDLRVIQRYYLDIASSSINREVFAWMLARAMSSPEAAAMFKKERIQPQGPTVVALERAIARGELAGDTNIELAMHVVQGQLISKRTSTERAPIPASTRNSAVARSSLASAAWLGGEP